MDFVNCLLLPISLSSLIMLSRRRGIKYILVAKKLFETLRYYYSKVSSEEESWKMIDMGGEKISDSFTFYAGIGYGFHVAPAT